jgi:hypothetical protein
MKNTVFLVVLALSACQQVPRAEPNTLQRIGDAMQKTGREMQANTPSSSTTTCSEVLGAMHCRTTY